MFRSATVQEVTSLLQAFDCPYVPVDDLEQPETAKIAQLSKPIREMFLREGGVLVLNTMKDNGILRQEVLSSLGVELQCSCFDYGLSCLKCETFCTSIAESVLGVLERDFLQLLHGDKSHLLKNRPGVEFLLSGIALSLLYQSVPEKQGVDELVLTLLLMMTDLPTWTRALQNHGPAPPHFEEVRSQRSLTLSQKAISQRRRLRKAPVDPEGAASDCCAECGKAFSDYKVVHECDCGAASVRYMELVKDPSGPSAVKESKGSLLTASFRARSLSF